MSLSIKKLKVPYYKRNKGKNFKVKYSSSNGSISEELSRLTQSSSLNSTSIISLVAFFLASDLDLVLADKITWLLNLFTWLSSLCFLRDVCFLNDCLHISHWYLVSVAVLEDFWHLFWWSLNLALLVIEMLQCLQINLFETFVFESVCFESLCFFKCFWKLFLKKS